VRVSEAMVKLFGFNPIRVRAARDKSGRDRRVTDGIKTAAGRLTARYYHALDQNLGDAALNAVMEEIQEFNEKHPESAVTAATISASIKAREYNSATAEQNRGVPTNKRYFNALEASNEEYSDEF